MGQKVHPYGFRLDTLKIGILAGTQKRITQVTS